MNLIMAIALPVIAIALWVAIAMVLDVSEKLRTLRLEIEMLEASMETYYEHCYWAATDDLREKGRL